VLNTIIEQYKDNKILLTSIGLDGERIDNVTNQEKPRIKAYKGMLVATAENCLELSTAKYVIHEKTNIRTALGNVIVIEIIKEGLVLIAGPATRNQMIQLFDITKKHNPYKIFIDGALYRKSIASTLLSDGIIFVTGASYSNDIKKVVNDTKIVIDQLSIKSVKMPVKMYENNFENTVLYYENSKNQLFISESLLNKEYLLEKHMSPELTHLFLPGALTDRIVETILQNISKINDLQIIVQDSSFILISPQNYKKMLLKGIKINVLNQIEIIFVAYNPVSPYSYDFDNLEFKAKLSEEIAFEPINILQDLR